jgi:hypothetical protein
MEGLLKLFCTACVYVLGDILHTVPRDSKYLKRLDEARTPLHIVVMCRAPNCVA